MVPRIGEILIQDGGQYLVRWEDDGTEEELTLSAADETLSRQSLRYQHLIDPESVDAAFQSNPAAVVLRVVAESGEPISQKAIRRALSRLGVSDFDVDKFVPDAWHRLLQHDAIKTLGSPATERMKVAWIGGDPSLQPVQGTLDEAGRPVEAHPETTGGKPDQRDAIDEPTALPELGGSALETAAEPGEQPGESSTPVPADPAPSPAAQFPEQPDGAAPEPAEPTVETPNVAPSDMPGLPDDLALDALLAAAVGQIASTGGNTSEQRDAFAELLRRCAATEDEVTPALVSNLVEVASAVAAGGPRYADVIEATLRQVAALILQAKDKSGDLDLSSMAAVAIRLPFTPHGGRVALLRAIAQVQPGVLAADQWWVGVTLKDLTAAARGGFGGVTSLQDVAEQIVRPLVLQELARANTVARLGAVFGLPGEFVSLIPPRSVAAALRRIAGDNPAVAGWLKVLAGAEESERQNQELQRARKEVAQAEALVQQAERQSAELAERCRRLEEMVRSDHTQAVQLRSAQDRQIRIDGVRSLAELAAEVEELAAENAASKMLVDRVRALVAVHDLEPLGKTGEESPFDPSTHDPIGDLPEPGVPVTVIRPGYRWRPSGEDILLDKALVTIV